MMVLSGAGGARGAVKGRRGALALVTRGAPRALTVAQVFWAEHSDYFLPKARIRAALGWLMSHSSPAALRAVSHGVAGLQNPGTRVGRTDAHFGK